MSKVVIDSDTLILHVQYSLKSRTTTEDEGWIWRSDKQI